jgi:hypothetical protein
MMVTVWEISEVAVPLRAPVLVFRLKPAGSVPAVIE